MTMTDYDDFAAAYAAENEKGLFNAHYARPAILGLAGDVAGRRLLDAGCGSGPLMVSMRDGGAEVAGFDVSAAMVDLARERLGDDAALRVHDLQEPLPYADGEFDDVICSLVLHYLEDWSGPLAELRRVLKPGGRLLVAVNHPTAYAVVYPDADYFKVTQYTEDYRFDGREVFLTFFHRPLSAMSASFTRAGFRISVLSEPPLSPDTPPELRPPGFEGEAFICFLFVVLEAV
ncbi:methyltransferase [Knoellia flava TL1]|uniref:Methyltransferase n=2 Tax=Knoellia flava TaxID=913969 RepID=A0A8H9FWR5_9MICO|nr:class I SAM-dependent methyltransferase [Knoellia flava]KGN30249.1 methyltransferase [Knoellia flava TL1]GGB84635.1 methyltransferase [Knoellia flava]